jgi:hypothetical protein
MEINLQDAEEQMLVGNLFIYFRTEQMQEFHHPFFMRGKSEMAVLAGKR